jgi:hypothetical protein
MAALAILAIFGRKSSVLNEKRENEKRKTVGSLGSLQRPLAAFSKCVIQKR